MRTTIKVLAIGFGLVATAAPIAAHHSWTAEYDAQKPVTVKGVVTKVEWTNPHTHYYLDVKDESGTVTSWNFEMASVLALERAGWTRKTLKVGDEVTIAGFGGKAVMTRAVASSITSADGRALFDGKLGQQ
jgi:DNA/RNA endonuclease YhcR with UshA esterase domain